MPQKVSLLGAVISLFFSNSLVAENSLAFDDGWCIGRSTLILSAFPSHSVAQDVYFTHSKSYILNGLNKFGATAENRSFLLEGFTEIENLVLSEVRSFVDENGLEALQRDIETFYLPEMLRRCSQTTGILNQ